MREALAITVAIFLVLSLAMMGKIVESVDADEIVVVQAPLSGELSFYTDPGAVWQGFGTVTTYKKRSLYPFDVDVRFNDGGKAEHVVGSVQYDLPFDKEHLRQIHTKLGSQDAVQRQLVKTVVDKALYMTGPMLTSYESYADKRNYLINWVQDQIEHGVYRTVRQEKSIVDPLTQERKTITTAEIAMKGGVPERQEASILEPYGITVSNFSLTGIKYEPKVEEQIARQQDGMMAVQTAIVNAKKAEQDKERIIQEGKAHVEQSRYEQEQVKVAKVTDAERDLEVQRLGTKQAELFKQQLILEGQGESEKKRLVMAADGALEKKVDAWLKSQQAWAAAFANYGGALVPSVVQGTGDRPSAGQAPLQLIELMGVKAAKDLALDMETTGRGKTKQ